MILEAAALTFLLADFAYHRWIEDKPVYKIPPQEISIPRVDEGAPIPLVFGRCRVRAPILAWTGTPVRGVGDVFNGWPSGAVFYQMDMFFVVGIPMADGNGTARVHGMWSGDRKFSPWGTTGAGADIFTEISASSSSEPGAIGSHAEYYDGSPTQDPGAGSLGTAQTAAGVPAGQISGYRRYLSVLLWNAGVGHWVVGSSPNVAAYSFEASSYYQGGSYPAPGSSAQVGQDSNPVNVLWDILVAKLGKLGLPSTYLDKPSFQSAGTTLQSETHGYSRCVESSDKADEIIQDVLRQIDGALDEDPSTGKLVLTLVRPVDPATIPSITKDNCEKLTNFVMSGWTGLPSSVRFIWTDRNNDYNDNTIVIHNQGNAINQGETEEMAVEMRGCNEFAQAATLADREAQARFRPIIKCRVLVGREFLRVVRGQAVKLTWKNPDISGIVFRVADVNRGTIDDGKISLDLISDYFYSARGEVQEPLIDRVDDWKDLLDDLVGP